MKNIFVGNLDLNTTEEELRVLFTAYGMVETVIIVTDRDTGQSRGLAFVEMTEAEEALAAILFLDGRVVNDRALRVTEARPKLAGKWSRTHPGAATTTIKYRAGVRDARLKQL